MLTDGTGKAPEQVISKATLKNKDQDVRETQTGGGQGERASQLL